MAAGAEGLDFLGISPPIKRAAPAPYYWVKLRNVKSRLQTGDASDLRHLIPLVDQIGKLWLMLKNTLTVSPSSSSCSYITDPILTNAATYPSTPSRAMKD